MTNSKPFQFLTRTRLDGWRAAGVWALKIVFGLRLVLGAAMALAWLAVKPYLSNSRLNAPEMFGGFDIPRSFPADALLGVWPRWDAINHLNLALRGYFDLPEGHSIFLPLLPDPDASMHRINWWQRHPGWTDCLHRGRFRRFRGFIPISRHLLWA